MTIRTRFTIFAILFAIVLLGQYFPKTRFAKILAAPHGPRADTKYMTRRELAQSGKKFLSYGIIFAAILAIFSWLISPSSFRDSPPPILMGIFFGGFLITSGAVLGGVYLLVRAAFRGEKDVPPLGEDEDQR